MITFYNHHDRLVAVQRHLKGRHREHCLCFTCQRFTPESRDENCSIANAVFENCKTHGIVSPVWECPLYVQDREKTQETKDTLPDALDVFRKLADLLIDGQKEMRCEPRSALDIQKLIKDHFGDRPDDAEEAEDGPGLDDPEAHINVAPWTPLPFLFFEPVPTITLCGLGDVIEEKDLPQDEKEDDPEELRSHDISSEKWREYIDYDGDGAVLARIPIRNPKTLITRPGGSTHRIVDAEGIVHIVEFPRAGRVVVYEPGTQEKPCLF